jgi:hypothetical protein
MHTHMSYFVLRSLFHCHFIVALAVISVPPYGCFALSVKSDIVSHESDWNQNTGSILKRSISYGNLF